MKQVRAVFAERLSALALLMGVSVIVVECLKLTLHFLTTTVISATSPSVSAFKL